MARPIYDVLLYADTRNGPPAGSPAFPPDYPALQQPYAGRPAPWIPMSQAEYDQQIADNKVAYEAWRLGNPPKPQMPASTLTAQNGDLYQVDGRGALVKL